MSHLAHDFDFKLQATVMSGNYFIAKASGNQVVRLRQSFRQQPSWSEFAAKLFIISEVKFDGPMQGRAAGFKRTNRKSIACEIALINRGSAPIKLAVMDFAAIGRISPTLAWWNNIAMRI